MTRNMIMAGVGIFVAGAALAHSGVMNPTVMARMDAMQEMAQNTKILGEMAKGKQDFDPALAQRSLARISQLAGETPALFRENATDPKSEALPAIWENFDDFSGKAQGLQEIAAGLSIAAERDLRPALAELGGACKACHGRYRE